MPAPDPDDVERSESGQPVYRHTERTADDSLASGDGEAIEAISNHIQAHVGPIEMVFHELVSPLVHVDVHHVEPGVDRPWHTLVTSGMSDRPMHVPDGAEDFAHAELVACLPPDWPLEQSAWEDENHYWPIRWLKMLARFPHEYETWVAYGHSIPNGDPPEPFADNTKLCGMLLLPPMTTAQEFWTLETADRKIHFWAIVPLYAEEIELKLQQGTDELLDRFQRYRISPVIDPRRRNVARKRLWGR
jgi:hypothetical protein